MIGDDVIPCKYHQITVFAWNETWVIVKLL